MQNQTERLNKNGWIPKPLNKTGDLNSWKGRMLSLCPNPKLGQVVWMNNDRNSIGYKVLSFRHNGEPIWQRGQVVWH